ncbi:MAG TPA: VOC family protein [Oligoflexus sp.]|uniref:VOC family protein n=1 Tax=Oligoflexus sp. TaxID=1971216 RepID=UPI002D80EC4B|nr:VOC family protein [Oligoflexus sp.]HET9240741.1 VOC family protein [Oligoflexus sp.]
MQVKLVSVIVDDQDKALRFYTEVLGFQKKTEIPLPEHKWVTLVSKDGPSVELALETNAHPAARAFQKAIYEDEIPLLTFFSDDVQKESEALVEKGVVFRVPPTQAAWGTYAVFEDTCGNLVQLHQN